ncbi:MAG: carboxypeptidase regulatory-like domain-containing protein, partial [Bacteroidia bacterium]
SALNKYKEVVKNRPLDGAVHFYIGECYYMMNDYRGSLDELERAKSLDPNATAELPLWLGKAYHARAMIDKALDELNAYRKTIANNQKQIIESDVDVEISQCNVAKQLMAKPIDVKIIPLIDINSQYDDKGPVLTDEDKTMIFTSRRPAGKKPVIDKEADFGYYDDIYQSTWDEEKKTWSSADLIRSINTDYYDACSSISADGNTMFIYKNAPGSRGDIYISQKTTGGKWKTPERLPKPVNTSYYEDAACLSPDGKTLFFVSEVPGGLGRGDIYTSKKLGKDSWSEPVNIGAPVNTPYDENGLYLSADGKTLFFCSDNPNSMGSYDIFKTTLGADGKWTSPVNLGYPINSVQIESKFVFTADHKTGYVSTVRDTGLGERDIYKVDLSNYDVMKGQSTVIPKSTLSGKITGEDGKAISAEIRILDKATTMQSALTKSSADGTYSIELPSKQYILEVNADGFQKFSVEISISAGQPLSKDVILKKNN